MLYELRALNELKSELVLSVVIDSSIGVYSTVHILWCIGVSQYMPCGTASVYGSDSLF